jgi:hypothetical protein
MRSRLQDRERDFDSTLGNRAVDGRVGMPIVDLIGQLHLSDLGETALQQRLDVSQLEWLLLNLPQVHCGLHAQPASASCSTITQTRQSLDIVADFLLCQTQLVKLL